MRFGTVAGRLVLIDGFGGGFGESFGPEGSALATGRALDVADASAQRLPADAVATLERWDELIEWAPSADWSAARTVTLDDLGPPVPAPRQVFAIALNYAPHAAEAGFSPPGQPLVFTKFPSCLTGPVATVPLPEGNVDWEIEVVAVVGRGGRAIPRERAWDALAGITLGQDLSERVLQLTGVPPQFSLAKSHPGFGPTGPFVVTADELPSRDDLSFAATLDGVPVQHGRTSQMIFPVDDLVARLSRVCPLLPGDLIFTGTPEGVGNRRTPPRFLQAGQTLVSRLDGVGQISQTFVPAD